MTDLSTKVDCYDILTLMLSALCHDLDHPGYNNTYQVPATTTTSTAVTTTVTTTTTTTTSAVRWLGSVMVRTGLHGWG